jgi:RHS repeat-associated protein
MKLPNSSTLFLTFFFYSLMHPAIISAGAYSSCSTSTYSYVCPWNTSLAYSGSTSHCISSTGGGGGGSSSGVVGGWGFLGGGYAVGPGGGSSNSSSSVGCVPPQSPDPSPPLSLTDSSAPCDEGKSDSPSEGASEAVGSEVDLFGLRYYDQHTDLKLAAPGGWLSVDRRYSNGSWRIGGTEVIIPTSKDADGSLRLSLSGRIFTKTDKKYPGFGQGQDRSGTYVSDHGDILQYGMYRCIRYINSSAVIAPCPWYRNTMLVTRSDGSWLHFSGDPLSGGLLSATGYKNTTHLIYDRDFASLLEYNPEIPFSTIYKVQRVLSGIEKDENGNPRVLLHYNYDTSYDYSDENWAMLESVTTYDIDEVAEPDPEEGQVGVFYEYYRGEGNDPDTGLLKSVTKPDGTSSTYTYNGARNLETKTDYAADGTSVLRHSSIQYHSSSLQAEDAIESSLMLGALGGPPNPVASVAYGSGESKRFDGNYNESTGGFYSKVSYSNGSIKEVWLDDEAQMVQMSLDGQVVRNIASVGRVERVTTRGNSVTIREYDEFDNLIRETLPSGHLRSWVYEPYTKLLDPFNGELVPGDLDEDEEDENFTIEATRMVSMVDEIGTETRYTYAESDWGTDANTVSYNTAPYNAIRSVKIVENGDDLSRTRWEYYDSLDRRVLEIGRIGDQIAYAYKGKTTLIEQSWRPEVLDADTGLPVVLYSQTFDSFGYLDTYTDAANALTSYDYSVSGQLLSETNALGVSTVYTYSGDELVEMEVGRVADPGDTDYQRGRVTRYSHDSSGRVLTAKRVDGEGVEYLYQTYAYNNMGQLVSMTDADGLTTEYTYDAYGNSASRSIPLPNARADESSATEATTYSKWNVFGDLLEETDAAGLVTRYAYDKLGRILTATQASGAPDARTLGNRYDGLGNIIETTYSISDGSEGVATYTYDAFGRVVARSGYGVYAETYDYYANDSLKSVTDAKGHTTTYTYDAFDRLYQVFEGATLVATRNYDVNGNLVEQIDAEGIHTHLAYDLLNRELYRSTPDYTAKAGGWWTDFANVALENAYNRFGQVETIRAAHGQEITRTYDDFGRLEGITYPTGATVRYEFTAADLPKRVLFPIVSTSGQSLGSEVLYTYDEANPSVVVALKSRSGETGYYYYDTAFRLARVDVPTGSVRTLAYDAFGRLASETDYASVGDFNAEVPYRTTQYSEYDDFDRLLELTLPSEGTQQMDYDDKGNLLKRRGASTYPVEYTYDSIGNLETMTTFYGDKDPATADTSVTRWEYDLRGRLERKVYGDNSDVDYTYYENNRLLTRTNARAQMTEYTYDAWGNIDLVDYPSGQTDVDYEYIKGRLDSMVDATGTTSWTYHSVNGLTATETKDFIADVDMVTIAWEYDSEGRRTLMTVDGLPEESEHWQTIYNYDRYGRLELIQDDRAHATNAFVYGYNAASGLLEQIDSPWQQNGSDAYLGEQRSYDNFGRLKSRQLNTSSEVPIIGVNTLTYDVLDRRTGASFFGGTLYASQTTRAFDYDEFSQLKEQKTGTEIDQAYDYDAIGNRLNWWQGDPVDPTTALDTYTPDSLNQYDSLTQHNEVTTIPVYDEDGNLEQQDGWTYTWDVGNRLIAAEKLAVQRIEYIYDGQGRRISKDVYDWDTASYSLASSYLYLYDGWNLISEFEVQGSTFSVQSSYTWGLDLSGTLQGAGGVGGLLAVIQNEEGVGTPYLAAYDFNGNIIGYVDPASETLVAEYEYDPFGRTVDSAGSKKDSFHFRFSTKYLDAETDLYYYGFRYYDAETGRWLNRDPLTTLVPSKAFASHVLPSFYNGYGELLPEGANVYAFVGNRPTYMVDPNGEFGVLAIAAVVFGGWAIYQVYDAFSDLAEIENVGMYGTIGAPGIQDKVAKIQDSACQIAENMPGTMITGPGTLPGHAFPLDDLVDAAIDLRKLSKLGQTQNIANKFKTIKSTMTGAGYDFIYSKSSNFGGYFKRPRGNPNNLPSPKEINSTLNELIL